MVFISVNDVFVRFIRSDISFRVERLTVECSAMHAPTSLQNQHIRISILTAASYKGLCEYFSESMMMMMMGWGGGGGAKIGAEGRDLKRNGKGRVAD
jgi:hypothetical protein